MIENRCPKDTFWAAWLLLFFALVFCLSLFSGCGSPPSEPQFKLITKEEKDRILLKELHLPPNTKNVNKIDEEWHTFELVIDGRTRKFLRRTYGVAEGGQYGHSTDTITELTPQ